MNQKLYMSYISEDYKFHKFLIKIYNISNIIIVHYSIKTSLYVRMNLTINILVGREYRNIDKSNINNNTKVWEAGEEEKHFFMMTMYLSKRDIG